MSNPLHIQCFEEGARRGLTQAALGHTKSARAAARIIIDPLRRKELAALGERLFRESINPSTPLSGLKSVFMPGFGQRTAVKNLIARYPSMYRGASPANRDVVKKLFQQQLQQHFAEMGHIAKPKMDFVEKTLPAVGAATAGTGLGIAGGAAVGGLNRQNAVEARLKNMPMWDRMKYLILPSSLNVRPKLPASYEQFQQ